MQVVVGRIGRPHGVRGDVNVEVRTDEPERRFATGAVLADRPCRVPAPSSVEAHRWHSGRLLVHFEGVDDRTAVEAVARPAAARPMSTPRDRPDDPDEFYDHQLVGLTVSTDLRCGARQRSRGRARPAQDLLVVTVRTVRQVLVPFVGAHRARGRP